MSRKDDLVKALRFYLHDTASSEMERANVLLDIVRQFYDFTKFEAPGGRGLDGKDGPERTELGAVLEAADGHVMAAFTRQTHP